MLSCVFSTKKKKKRTNNKKKTKQDFAFVCVNDDAKMKRITKLVQTFPNCFFYLWNIKCSDKKLKLEKGLKLC